MSKKRDSVRLVELAKKLKCTLHSDGVFYETPSMDFLLELKEALDTTIMNYNKVEVMVYSYNENKFATMTGVIESPNKKNRPFNGQFVYLIHNEHQNIYKIGTSKNPKSRLSALQSVTIEPLSLIGYIPGGYDLERKIHNKYKHLRIHGEWFCSCSELINEFLTTQK